MTLLSGILWSLRGLHTLAFDGKDKGRGAPATNMVIKYAIKRKLADASAAVDLQVCATQLRQVARDIDQEVHRAGLHVESDSAAHDVEEAATPKIGRLDTSSSTMSHDRSIEVTDPAYLKREESTRKMLHEGIHKTMRKLVSHRDLARLLHEGEAGDWDAGVIAQAASEEAVTLAGPVVGGASGDVLGDARLRLATAIRACKAKWAQARLLALAADMRDLAAVSHRVRGAGDGGDPVVGGGASAASAADDGKAPAEEAAEVTDEEDEPEMRLLDAKQRLGLLPMKEEDRLAKASHDERRTLLDHALKHVLRKHLRIWCLAAHWECDKAWQMRPLVNGKELMKMGAPPREGMRQLMQEQTDWQLVRPRATKEECVAFLQERIAAMTAGKS